MKLTLRELANQLDCRLFGDPSTAVTAVSSLQSATTHSLVFVEHSNRLDAALSTSAAAIIVPESAEKQFAEKKSADEIPDKESATKNSDLTKPVLISPNPRLAFARAAKLLRGHPPKTGIHPSAIIPASAKLGSNVAIGARAILGEHTTIGAETTIGAGSVIGDNTGPAVKIGNHCRIDPNVTIYTGTTLGDRVVVQAGAVLGSEGFGYVRDPHTGRYEQSPQIGRLIIEDDVEIGANSTVARGALDETRIRQGTKIDNLVHIGHNVQIGENVIIAAQTGVSGSATIEDNVIIGGQVGIADHVRIEEGAILGAQSGIPTKKVIRGKGVVFWGTPARPLKEYLKELAFLSRAAKQDR